MLAKPGIKISESCEQLDDVYLSNEEAHTKTDEPKGHHD